MPKPAPEFDVTWTPVELVCQAGFIAACCSGDWTIWRVIEDAADKMSLNDEPE